MSADEIIIDCVVTFFIPTKKRSISSDVWKEACRRLHDAGIHTYRKYNDVEDHFWKDIFPKLESEYTLDAAVLDQIYFAKWLKIKNIRVVMRQEGIENPIADDIFPEMYALVQYKRFDEFCRERYEVLKNLTRDEYHINLDDPRLNLTRRIKLKLVTPQKNASVSVRPIEDTPMEEDPVEPTKTKSNSSQKQATLEVVGKASIFKVPSGMNVHMQFKDGIYKCIAVPASQDTLEINTQMLNDLAKAPDQIEPSEAPATPPPPATPNITTERFEKIFDPPETSTQTDMMLSPIRPLENASPRGSIRANLSIALPYSFAIASGYSEEEADSASFIPATQDPTGPIDDDQQPFQVAIVPTPPRTIVNKEIETAVQVAIVSSPPETNVQVNAEPQDTNEAEASQPMIVDDGKRVENVPAQCEADSPSEANNAQVNAEIQANEAEVSQPMIVEDPVENVPAQIGFEPLSEEQKEILKQQRRAAAASLDRTYPWLVNQFHPQRAQAARNEVQTSQPVDKHVKSRDRPRKYRAASNQSGSIETYSRPGPKASKTATNKVHAAQPSTLEADSLARPSKYRAVTTDRPPDRPRRSSAESNDVHTTQPSPTEANPRVKQKRSQARKKAQNAQPEVMEVDLTSDTQSTQSTPDEPLLKHAPPSSFRRFR